MRLIDADALWDRAFELWGFAADEDETNIFMETIDEAPTIDAEPIRHGKWIAKKPFGNFLSMTDEYECSYCHEINKILINRYGLLPFYCPNCGAKMALEVKENA